MLAACEQSEHDIATGQPGQRYKEFVAELTGVLIHIEIPVEADIARLHGVQPVNAARAGRYGCSRIPGLLPGLHRDAMRSRARLVCKESAR